MSQVRPSRVLLASALLALCGASALGADPTPYTSADEVRAIVAQMMSDADSRSSLMGDSGAAGYDGTFYIASADGNFRLNVVGELQFRYWANFDAQNATNDGGYDGGFQNARTRLELSGFALSPKLTYRILGKFNKAGTGQFELQDAWAEYRLADGLKLRWGQFKLPFDREFFDTRPTEVLAIDRSLVESVFRLDRSKGVQLSYQADRWRIFTAFSDGRKALNTDFDSPLDADAALSGRLEFRLGEAGWSQFRDQSSFRDSKFGVLIGLGAHWQQNGATGAPASFTGDSTLFSYTGDLGFEGDGWNLLAAVVGRTIDADGSLEDYGLLAQGGVFVTENTEIFARYAEIFPDPDRPNGDDFSAYTLGFNWFFIPGSEAVKLTTELTWYPETQADSSSIVSPNSSIGLLSDDSGGQFAIGVQMQVVF